MPSSRRPVRRIQSEGVPRASSSATTTTKKKKKIQRRSTNSSRRDHASNNATIYENVNLNSVRGSLTLSDAELCFESNDGGKKIHLNWDQLSDHKINRSVHKLKIISKKNKAKVLELPDRSSLIQVHKDIQRRKSSTGITTGNSADIRISSSMDDSLRIQDFALNDTTDNNDDNDNEFEPLHSSMPVIPTDHSSNETDSSSKARPKLRKTKSQTDRKKKKKKKKDPLSSISEHQQKQPEYNWKQHLKQLKLQHSKLKPLQSLKEEEDEETLPKIDKKKTETDDATLEPAKRLDECSNKTDEDAGPENKRISLELSDLGPKQKLAKALVGSSLTEDGNASSKRQQMIDALTSSVTSNSSNDGNNSKRTLPESLNNSLTGSFNMTEEEMEAQILLVMGGNANNTNTTSNPPQDEKAARKSRMSMRMSTRVSTMNANRRTSRMSNTTNTNKRMSTRMSMTNNPRMSTRMSVTRRGSGSFIMLKDLEERDEFHKVQAAGFLRELYKLAEAETNQALKETILTRSTSSGPVGGGGGASGGGKADGDINFEGLDLATLTPEQGKAKIDALHAGGKIDGDSLIALIQAGVTMLGQEETVVDIRQIHPNLQKVTAVGDLHGSLECLMVVLKMADLESIMGEEKGSVIVFDGDFVDRGNNSLEVIATLLLLKLSHPKNVFLLRGNHEDSMTASSYGFREEVDEKYGYDKGDEIWWEFGYLFAAFPIVARTNMAAIMHGGLCVEEFDLDDLNEIAKETRCEMKTISDPYDDEERLLQGILWSDPSEEPGINFSDRGAGFTFGADISADFLDRHELKYIIRAHEVVETGHCEHDVGEGRGVITIFSSANYPAGEGTNYGAVLFLDDQSGEYTTKDFIHKEDTGSQESEMLRALLGTFVDGHKSHLTKAFREKQTKDGLVTCEQWSDVIAELLELPDICLTLLDMQPELAPATEEEGDHIDWTAFLNKYTTIPTAQVLAKDQLAALSENKDKFLDIFQLMDTSGDGNISKEEFVSGMNMLNEQIDQNIDDAEKLFEAFDVDSDGEISILEFSKAIQSSTVLQGMTEALKDDQVEHLKQNQEMISTSFKYLDSNKDGVIDRSEFEKGFEALNQRLPERNKFGNYEDWFNMFELSDKEQIEFNAFKQLFCSI
ncbi:protein phosphatase PP1 [Seminavis robusta]|uniref:Serine/threonine-protein phosphatase n=1 Tax=Seminavis robusta TaxID=568900 RepID=A0A9N8EW79_9STRA|nr:protein phosphatase PP1 [Seminavis robusta]|eukprot:Sro2101_g314530.1 protein phosphatase PP1 (1138) ;mRNA; f:952-4452